MRSKGLLLAMFLLSSLLIHAQENTGTLHLNQSSNALLHGLAGQTTNNFGAFKELRALTWTNGGKYNPQRSLIRFDVSGLPVNAIIESATLHLKGDGHYPLNKPNNSRLYLVEGSWDPESVTWDDQPVYNSGVYSDIAPTTYGQTTYENRDVDVTEMVKRWHAGIDNQGLMFKLNNEAYYTKMLFHSGAADDSNNWPVLEINYSLPEHGVLTWDASNSSSSQTISTYSVRKTDAATAWNCYAISNEKVYPNCEAFVKFKILNCTDNYNVGFSDDFTTDRKKHTYGIGIRADEDKVWINYFYINNVRYTVHKWLSVMDEITLAIEKESDGSYGLHLYHNGAEIALSSLGVEDTSYPNTNTLWVKANLHTLNSELTRLGFYTSGRIFYVNDNSQSNDIWCTQLGSSENTGTSPDSPKASIAEVLSSITDLSANDIILVDAGEYTQSYTGFLNKHYGTEDLPLRIYGAGRGLSRLYGSNKSPILVSNSSNIEFKGFSILAEENESANYSLIEIEGSSQIAIRDCYLQNDHCDEQELLQFKTSNNIGFSGNVIVQNNNLGSIIRMDDCSEVKIEKNRMDGGATSIAIYNTLAAELNNTNVYINRNFLSNSTNGIYISGSVKETDLLYIQNNSFYSKNACLLADHNLNLSNTDLVNNVFETTTATGFNLSIPNFEGNGAGTKFFKRLSHSIFFNNYREECTKIGGNTYNLSAFLTQVASYENTSLNSSSISAANPLYLYPGSGNLNVQTTSPAVSAGVQDVYFAGGTDANGINYESVSLGGGSSFNFSPTVNYAELKRKLDASYHLPGNMKLYIKYDEEYNVTSNADLTFAIYNDYHTKVADLSTHPGLITRNTGANYLTVNLCGVSGTDYMILEVINDKGEKLYLRFKSPTAWYASDCGLEYQNTTFNIEPSLTLINN